MDKNVVVGAGTQLGWGDDLDTPNAAASRTASTPARPSSARARTFPATATIGRNVVIQADVDEEHFGAFGERRAERRDGAA